MATRISKRDSITGKFLGRTDKSSIPSHTSKSSMSGELFSVYIQCEASLARIDEGVLKTVDKYIDDLIQLGKE